VKGVTHKNNNFCCFFSHRSQLAGASVHGLLALAALGLMAGDDVLASAALAELTPHEHSTQHTSHVAFLRAANAALRVTLSTLFRVKGS